MDNMGSKIGNHKECRAFVLMNELEMILYVTVSMLTYTRLGWKREIARETIMQAARIHFRSVLSGLRQHTPWRGRERKEKSESGDE